MQYFVQLKFRRAMDCAMLTDDTALTNASGTLQSIGTGTGTVDRCYIYGLPMLIYDPMVLVLLKVNLLYY